VLELTLRVLGADAEGAGTDAEGAATDAERAGTDARGAGTDAQGALERTRGCSRTDTEVLEPSRLSGIFRPRPTGSRHRARARGGLSLDEAATCIVHLLRDSLDFASGKQRKPLAAALRVIYTAPSAGLVATRSMPSRVVSGPALPEQRRGVSAQRPGHFFLCVSAGDSTRHLRAESASAWALSLPADSNNASTGN
jgi:hypothetical protein